MSKPHPERPAPVEATADVPPLAPGIRRHLGRTLRSQYADSLAAPVSERLEALIAQLVKPKD
ncbi:hypothetical protein MKK63_12165 [Methylobacterium sp. J-088]|uniref:hypothetical protein n=1 Tax=unclassified Methylobacterium TaxID=2615210 RepID=UPI001FBA075F|nr:MULTISPECIES: hypothetical protein [unclassified Methylobacterium]MCJ2063462.1 hypothetical protein [Methylobacterium sp. J-088]